MPNICYGCPRKDTVDMYVTKSCINVKCFSLRLHLAKQGTVASIPCEPHSLKVAASMWKCYVNKILSVLS